MLDVLAGDLPGEERLKTALELRSICGGMSTEKVLILLLLVLYVHNVLIIIQICRYCGIFYYELIVLLND